MRSEYGLDPGRPFMNDAQYRRAFYISFRYYIICLIFNVYLICCIVSLHICFFSVLSNISILRSGDKRKRRLQGVSYWGFSVSVLQNCTAFSLSDGRAC